MKTFIFIFTFLVSIYSAFGADWKKVECIGTYSHHLQGIAIGGEKIYWSYTTKILRTDSNGTIEKITDAPSHQGDCCFNDGKLYVATNLGKFNTKTKAKNFVYIYDADLKFERAVPIEGLEGGLGGMEFHDGHFYMVGGVDKSETHFKICKYTPDFKLVKTYLVPVGESELGVQTICRAYGKFWLGCYIKKGAPKKRLWVMDDDFNIIEKLPTDASFGIAPIQTKDGANFLIAFSIHDRSKKLGGYTANATPVKITNNK